MLIFGYIIHTSEMCLESGFLYEETARNSVKRDPGYVGLLHTLVSAGTVCVAVQNSVWALNESDAKPLFACHKVRCSSVCVWMEAGASTVM